MNQHKMMYLDTKNWPNSVNVSNVDDTFNVIYNTLNKDHVQAKPIVINGCEFKTINEALLHRGPRDADGNKVPNYWLYVAKVVLEALRHDDKLRGELIAGKPIVAISVITSVTRVHSFKSMKSERGYRMYVGVLRAVADVLKKYPITTDFEDAELREDLVELANKLLDSPSEDLPT